MLDDETIQRAAAHYAMWTGLCAERDAAIARAEKAERALSTLRHNIDAFPETLDAVMALQAERRRTWEAWQAWARRDEDARAFDREAREMERDYTETSKLHADYIQQNIDDSALIDDLRAALSEERRRTWEAWEAHAKTKDERDKYRKQRAALRDTLVAVSRTAWSFLHEEKLTPETRRAHGAMATVAQHADAMRGGDDGPHSNADHSLLVYLLDALESAPDKADDLFRISLEREESPRATPWFRAHVDRLRLAHKTGRLIEACQSLRKAIR